MSCLTLVEVKETADVLAQEPTTRRNRRRAGGDLGHFAAPAVKLQQLVTSLGSGVQQ
jgi:hypothetical protein